jgi:hypothetical protein
LQLYNKGGLIILLIYKRNRMHQPKIKITSAADPKSTPAVPKLFFCLISNTLCCLVVVAYTIYQLFMHGKTAP